MNVQDPSLALKALRTARRAYQRLPGAARVAVWAVVVAGPVFAFSAGGGGNDDEAPESAMSAGSANEASHSGAPLHSGSSSSSLSSSAASGTADASAAAGDATFVRSVAATQSFDPTYELEKIERAGRYATVDEEDGLDLDDALDLLKKRVREASTDSDVFKAIRKSP